MIHINKISCTGIKNVSFQIYGLYLNEVRKNLVAPGKPLLPSPKSAYFWCSTIETPYRRDAGRTIPVGDLARSPLNP